MSLIKELVAANLSRTVTALVSGSAVAYTVDSVKADRTGKLKDGTEDNYVVLVSKEDATATIELNPRKADQLFKKGTVDNLTLEAVDTTATAPTTETTDATEKPAAKAKEPKQPKALKEAKPPKDPALNKSFHFLAAYKAAVAAATDEAPVSRKAVIADARVRIANAGLGEISDAATNTYYQNCKSGQWA